ncbi:hypothetical protein DCMF_25310 [Candidatus Formimonas warabiya]|uniref:Uncharacterized protein n=1 Tax=Formimonas warabiya TaxID=1761012 RepID=A0A3G1KYU2_FORW1|nr:hypothetical protein DCMF_25310 [Candidatus Formimonas warabiya]
MKLFFQVPKRFRIWACTDTSKLLVGSSSTTSFGITANDRAMHTRCSWPQLNWRGSFFPSFLQSPGSGVDKQRDAANILIFLDSMTH